MTIIEVINKADAETPNGYSQTEKIGWLSMLDGIIKTEIIDAHLGAEGVEFSEYNDLTPLNTELLVPHPYDELYVHFIESRIHWANEEYAKYNNAVAMYNAAYNKYQAYYNRTHMPISRGRFKF